MYIIQNFSVTVCVTEISLEKRQLHSSERAIIVHLMHLQHIYNACSLQLFDDALFSLTLSYARLLAKNVQVKAKWAQHRLIVSNICFNFLRNFSFLIFYISFVLEFSAFCFYTRHQHSLWHCCTHFL